MSKSSKRVRDARTGQFVPSGEAKRRPATASVNESAGFGDRTFPFNFNLIKN